MDTNILFLQTLARIWKSIVIFNHKIKAMQIRVTIIFWIALTLFITVFTGCAARRMARQASDFERAGMFREASELYYQASLRKPGRVDYLAGLRRSGQMYVEEVESHIADSYRQGSNESVVYDFLALENFVSRIGNTGVQLRIQHSTRNLYRNAQEGYLTERYETGLRLISEEKYHEAKVVFTDISNINPDFRDTRTYLNIATLEPIYQRGASHFGQRNYMAAYNDWRRVAATDPNYKDVRQRMQQALSERYRQGSLALVNEDFSEAARALGDVYNADPTFRDVKSLFIEARAEPMYRRASSDLESGRCRRAWYTFNDIMDIAGGDYKQASSKVEIALKCGSFAVAVHARNMPNHSADGTVFENLLAESILDKEDPFLKIFKLPSVNNRIHRSFLTTTGPLNRSQLRELHDRQGIQAVLVLNFNQYSKSQGGLERVERTGFDRVSRTTEEGEMLYRDRRVTYFEFSRENRVALQMNFQLVSTLNGEILLSRNFSASENSFINYAQYEGENRNLFPSMSVQNNLVIDERNYQQLQRLLNASREIEPVDKLREKVFMNIAGRIAESLVNFNPEN